MKNFLLICAFQQVWSWSDAWSL